MSKKIDYDDILNRIGFFRNRANLSARETSFRLEKGELYLSRIENKQVELKVSTLLNLMEIFNITIQDFFYLGSDYDENDKNILELYSNLSKENKEIVIDLIKRLK